MSFVTRIAPTPSGYLHRGNAYNFLLVWLLARTHSGKIVLRIDDLDKGRYRPRFLESIFFDLDWMGIDWDVGPSSMKDAHTFGQYGRMESYKDSLAQVRSNPLIFGCTCTRKIIRRASPNGQYPGTCRHREVSEDNIWRIWTKGEWAVLNSEKKFLENSSVVLRNRKGIPSYMFACVVDDWIHEVDVIVRGEDLYEASVTQSYLRRILGIQKEPIHIHHPLLLDENGRKLSKSTKSVSLSALREDGMTKSLLYQGFAQWRGWKSIPTDTSSLLDIFQHEDALGVSFSVHD